MKLKYISSAFIAVSLLLTACSDKDNWEPGEPAPDNMGVFFTNLDKYDVTIEIDDSHVFKVGVGRIETTDAANVPLKVVSCPEGVKVPSSIEFAAGQETASFEIDATDMPLKSSGNVVLQIDPQYAAMYGAGSSQMTMKLTTAGGWELIADNLVISCYLTSNPNIDCTLYNLDGTARFKIPDFMGSGTDFIFYMPTPSYSSNSVIYPYTNCQYYYELWPEDYEDDEDYPWYFYNTEEAQYPAIWTPQGWPKSIEYVTFYPFDDGDLGCYLNFKKGYGQMLSYIEFADGSGSWEYFELNFTPKYNPFE